MSKKSSKEPVPFDDEMMPPFSLPEWRSLGVSSDQFKPSKMSRHFLVLGETGSGKTYSAVMPIIRAALDYGQADSKLKPSMLIIDPKFELVNSVKKILGASAIDRLIQLRLDKDDYKLDFYEGVSSSDIDGMFIIDQLSKIAPSATEAHRDPYWEISAKSLIRRLIDLDIFLKEKLGTPSLWDELRTVVKDNFSGASEMLLEPSIIAARRSIVEFFEGTKQVDPYKNYFQNFSSILSLTTKLQSEMFEALEKLCKRHEVPPEVYIEFMTYRYMGSQQYASIVSFAINFLDYPKAPGVAKHVQLCPYHEDKKCLKIKDALNDGKIMLFSPGDEALSSGVFVARVLKAKLFQLSFEREEKERPIFYVCDEFQRFISSDPSSGEQSFLDRCRAYRVICVLSTQGLSSLSYALQTTSRSLAYDAAINILLTNTGNKLFFRNTDPQIQGRLLDMIPEPPVTGRPHLTKVRPASTLSVGECYFVLSDGTWGRGSVDMHGRQ